MCPSGASCLPAYCCFSELALLKSNKACWSSRMRTPSSRQNVECSRYDMAEKLFIWCCNRSLTNGIGGVVRRNVLMKYFRSTRSLTLKNGPIKVL
jgi:hypothetical protein